MDNLFNEIKKAFIEHNDLKAKTLSDDIYLEMCTSPMHCLRTIFKKSGYTKNELVEISEIGERTIEYYLYSFQRNYQKKVLVRLLLSLNIPPLIFLHILNICGCSLNIANEFDSWIAYIIQHRWYKAFKENLEFLEKINIFI